jgi:hypothetical protein
VVQISAVVDVSWIAITFHSGAVWEAGGPNTLYDFTPFLIIDHAWVYFLRELPVKKRSCAGR